MDSSLINSECEKFIIDLSNKMFTKIDISQMSLLFEDNHYIGLILRKEEYNVCIYNHDSFIYTDRPSFYLPLVDFNNGMISCLRDFGLPIILERNNINIEKFYDDLKDNDISYFADMYHDVIRPNSKILDENFHYFNWAVKLNGYLKKHFNKHSNDVTYDPYTVVQKINNQQYVKMDFNESIDLMSLKNDIYNVPVEIKTLIEENFLKNINPKKKLV